MPNCTRRGGNFWAKKCQKQLGIRDLECVCAQWEFLTSGVAYVAAVIGSEVLIPSDIWPPGAGGGAIFRESPPASGIFSAQKLPLRRVQFGINQVSFGLLEARPDWGLALRSR